MTTSRPTQPTTTPSAQHDPPRPPSTPSPSPTPRTAPQARRADTPDEGTVISTHPRTGDAAPAEASAPVAGSSAGPRRYAPSVGRIPVLDVGPAVAGGRRPARAVPGESFEVTATVFREGHDAVGADVVLTGPRGRANPYTPMHEVGIGEDRYAATVTVPAGRENEGDWTFHVEAWSDPMATWRHNAEIKVPAGIDVELVLEEGARLLERAAGQQPEADAEVLAAAAEVLRDTAEPVETRLEAGLGDEVSTILRHRPLRDLVTPSEPLPLRVDRERALYGAWYEFFPRSEGASLNPPRSGTLRTAAARLAGVAAMGFDVVYLPPVHPIGTSYRKGANKAVTARRGEPGSPWAIGSADGGHDAIHPDLGTIEDFDAFVARANGLGLEVALDFALQCSPDHPWVKEHPQWFAHRPDGTIAYAENPPKKYQDIYPIVFDNDPDGLVAEVLRVLRHWMAHGVRIFRVDNPHTKPVAFWERVIGEIAATDPDVVFLSEAFTRPAMMRTLAQVGFHQSYTYFTWRNTKDEVQSYLDELSHGPASAYMRPNLFVNTPDILHAYLQYGGRAAFKIRAVLAALGSPSWGVYSGYELCEAVPVRVGSEEYLNSEKYAYRPRNWAAAEAEGRSLAPFLRRLNQVRRAHPALHQLRNLRFHYCDDDSTVAFSKLWRDPAGTGSVDCVLAVVNLDPHGARETGVHLDLPALGITGPDAGSAGFDVHDELSGATYRWGAHNYVRLDPRDPALGGQVAHVFTVRHQWSMEQASDRQ